MAALRAVDRYGVTRRGEQYTGWKALPGPSTLQAMGLDAALNVLANNSDVDRADIARNPDSAKTAYRQACMKTHPDRGGSADAFGVVTSAAKIVAAVHHLHSL